MKELKRVVITGLGAITPLGNNVDEFWENIVALSHQSIFRSLHHYHN